MRPIISVEFTVASHQSFAFSCWGKAPIEAYSSRFTSGMNHKRERSRIASSSSSSASSVEPGEVEPGGELVVVCSHAVRRGSRCLAECGPDGVIDDLLHRSPVPVYQCVDQPGHIIVTRQGGTHGYIVVLVSKASRCASAATSCLTRMRSGFDSSEPPVWPGLSC